jgi:hypothetical protein
VWKNAAAIAKALDSLNTSKVTGKGPGPETWMRHNWGTGTVHSSNFENFSIYSRGVHPQFRKF